MALLAIGVLGVWYWSERVAIAEYEDLFQYKLQVNPSTGIPEAMSAIAGDRYCVKRTTLKKKGPSLLILVAIGLCRDGQSGGFIVPLQVTDDIKEVRFGRKGYLLWSRQR
ncbi:MAG: hypothetical protein ABSA12_13250 [Verrucomicrobiia bacterium]